MGGRLPPMAPCGCGVEPSAPRTARDGRLRDRCQRPGQESSISKSASAAPALFHILNACCTFSTVRRCCTPLPPAASTPPITRCDPRPRAYSAQIGAPASSAASHQISSPFTCTSCPHACDAASCMPRATSWLCLPPSDPVTMPSCCRFITRMPPAQPTPSSPPSHRLRLPAARSSSISACASSRFAGTSAS